MLTASMYAGAHILQQYSTLAEIKLSLQDSQGDETGEIVSEKESNKPNHLIYGVAGKNNCDEIIVTSFYDKSIHIFRRCNN
uniref:Uncharacterized protein n=1 Tax=Tetranychus urticae TaxID=32264 RepID=T1JW88_TETUR